jgi:hypothetical protein
MTSRMMPDDAKHVSMMLPTVVSDIHALVGMIDTKKMDG